MHYFWDNSLKHIQYIWLALNYHNRYSDHHQSDNSSNYCYSRHILQDNLHTLLQYNSYQQHISCWKVCNQLHIENILDFHQYTSNMVDHRKGYIQNYLLSSKYWENKINKHQKINTHHSVLNTLYIIHCLRRNRQHTQNIGWSCLLNTCYSMEYTPHNPSMLWVRNHTYIPRTQLKMCSGDNYPHKFHTRFLLGRIRPHILHSWFHHTTNSSPHNSHKHGFVYGIPRYTLHK